MHGLKQKSPIRTKMPGSTHKCPTQHALVDIAIIKHPPTSLLKWVSNFIQMLCFKEPIHKLKQNYHCQDGATVDPGGQARVPQSTQKELRNLIQ